MSKKDRKPDSTPVRILKALFKKERSEPNWAKYSNNENALLSMGGVMIGAPASVLLGYPGMTLNTMANRQQWPNQKLIQIAKKDGVRFKMPLKAGMRSFSGLSFLENSGSVAAVLMRGGKTVVFNGPVNKVAFMAPPVVIDALTKDTKLEKYGFLLGLFGSAGFQGVMNYHARKAHLYESVGKKVKNPAKYFWVTNFSPKCLGVHISYFIWASTFTLGGMKLGEAFWRDRAPEYYDVLGSLTTLPFVQIPAAPAIKLATILMSPGNEKMRVKDAVKLIDWRKLFMSKEGLILLGTMTAWKLIENGSLRVITLRTKSALARGYDAYKNDDDGADPPVSTPSQFA